MIWVPPRRQPPGFAAVIAAGDRPQSLKALRDFLAQQLENAAGGLAIAPVAKELRAVMAELESLPSVKGSAVDELAKRRTSRRAAAAGQ